MTDSTSGLTGTECTALFVLAAESRPVPNPELRALGCNLEKDSRDRLRGRGLIEVARGPRNANVISLSDKGWATAGELLAGEPPARSTPATRALFTVARGLARYLRRESLALGEVFLPDAEPSGTPEPPAATVERVWDAYHRAARHSGAWVSLAAVRAALTDLPRREVDDALTEMYVMPGVDIVPEDNRKALTAADRGAALRLGGRDLHAMRIVR